MNKFLFIVNPIAGTKSKERILRLIHSTLPKEGYDVTIRQTQAKGDAVQWARETDADVVVAVGGDGTVHEVAQGILGSRKSLGIIPCGSGNGLALHLGISRVPRVAIHSLSEGKSQYIDYGMIDGREAFFCTAGVGLDASIAWEFGHENKRGLWSYITLAWKIWRHSTPQDYVVGIDNQTVAIKAAIITVGNANQWGNQARITSLASVQDGMLDVCIVEPFKTIEIPVLAAELLAGQTHKSRRIRMFRGAEISIHRQKEGPVHFDGEPYIMGTDIHFTVERAAVRVVVPARQLNI